MTRITFNQHLTRLIIPLAPLTGLRFTPRLQAIMALSKLQRLIIPIFPPTLVGNDDFITAHGEFITAHGESITW